MNLTGIDDEITMPGFTYANAVQGYGPLLQDRTTIMETETALLIAVADGAGGTSHGERAADLVITGLGEFARQGATFLDEETWATFLIDLDSVIAGDPEPGETTAVVLALTPELIRGASVGDSEAWLVTPSGCHDLTAQQQRKPLLGSGVAVPVAFRISHDGGTLVVGTDGLFKYAPAALIRDTVRRETPEEACGSLIARVRLPNGTLQDDVAVVVCRLPGPV